MRVVFFHFNGISPLIPKMIQNIKHKLSAEGTQFMFKVRIKDANGNVKTSTVGARGTTTA